MQGSLPLDVDSHHRSCVRDDNTDLPARLENPMTFPEYALTVVVLQVLEKVAGVNLVYRVRLERG